jgi:hypothetical protein
MKRIAVAIFAFVMSAAAIAAPHRQLDLRNQTDANGEYTISLCARPSPGPASLPGHAFVAYSVKPTGGERKFLTLGFTTGDPAIKGILSFSAILAKPDGYLDEEKFTSVNEECLVLLVNEKDFNAAYALAMPFYKVPALSALRYTGVYSLTNNDCMTFMINTAKQFAPRVKVPPRQATDLPLPYMRKLIDAN